MMRPLLWMLIVGCNSTTPVAIEETPETILNCADMGCIWFDAKKESTLVLDGGTVVRWGSASPSTSITSAVPSYGDSGLGITVDRGSLRVGSLHGMLRIDKGFGVARTELQFIIAAIEGSNPSFVVGTDPLLIANDKLGMRVCFNAPPTIPSPSNATCLEAPSDVWKNSGLHMFGTWVDHERNRVVFMVDGFERAIEGRIAAGELFTEIGGHWVPATDAGPAILEHLMEGRVAEVVQFLHPVSSSQMSALKRYITKKHGITF